MTNYLILINYGKLSVSGRTDGNIILGSDVSNLIQLTLGPDLSTNFLVGLIFSK